MTKKYFKISNQRFIIIILIWYSKLSTVEKTNVHLLRTINFFDREEQMQMKN